MEEDRILQQEETSDNNPGVNQMAVEYQQLWEKYRKQSVRFRAIQKLLKNPEEGKKRGGITPHATSIKKLDPGKSASPDRKSVKERRQQQTQSSPLDSNLAGAYVQSGTQIKPSTRSLKQQRSLNPGKERNQCLTNSPAAVAAVTQQKFHRKSLRNAASLQHHDLDGMGLTSSGRHQRNPLHATKESST